MTTVQTATSDAIQRPLEVTRATTGGNKPTTRHVPADWRRERWFQIPTWSLLLLARAPAARPRRCSQCALVGNVVHHICTFSVNKCPLVHVIHSRHIILGTTCRLKTSGFRSSCACTVKFSLNVPPGMVGHSGRVPAVGWPTTCCAKRPATATECASSSGRSPRSGRRGPASAGPRSRPRGSAPETGWGARRRACGFR